MDNEPLDISNEKSINMDVKSIIQLIDDRYILFNEME